MMTKQQTSLPSSSPDECVPTTNYTLCLDSPPKKVNMPITSDPLNVVTWPIWQAKDKWLCVKSMDINFQLVKPSTLNFWYMLWKISILWLIILQSETFISRCISFILVSFPVIYISNDMNLANVITASLHVACQALNLHVVLLIGNLYLFVIYI